ncbi:Aspartyl protease [Handroanthus impetiginosus]|uniref:Aspartyl protease n=1 Tax=Handroanthus impetiginosus TaxID=429701 RepID=A0A2G9I5W2_9LAMI|nr:Aspartyl protease [Handroanthus impetiginosus]
MKLQTIFVLCVALISVTAMPTFHLAEASGFSVDLIHRDSLQSPSLDASEHMTNALQRSFNRLKNDHYSPQSASAEIVPDKGEYLMKFALGTPPVETLAIADTGSDLTWIQCKPCQQCFKQKAPFFEPNRSSTYKPVLCTSIACAIALPRTSCNGSGSTCHYKITYGDGSYSMGDLATETLTLGSTNKRNVNIPNFIIGCGHLDGGTFGAGSSGIVGLGGGKVSLITQIRSLIQGKFSYCLVPIFGERNLPSKMNFGDKALVSGHGVATTPIVPHSPKTFYFLTLEGITVGNQRLDLVSSSSSPNSTEEGNIIIDSGTTLTFLPEVKLSRTSDPQGLLDLCYVPTGENDDALVPEITAHFKGADVKLNSYNSFVRTSETSLCLAYAPSTGVAIYGNLAQMNFLVGYDLEKKTVSFKPTDCSRQ